METRPIRGASSGNAERLSESIDTASSLVTFAWRRGASQACPSSRCRFYFAQPKTRRGAPRKSVVREENPETRTALRPLSTPNRDWSSFDAASPALSSNHAADAREITGRASTFHHTGPACRLPRTSRRSRSNRTCWSRNCVHFSSYRERHVTGFPRFRELRFHLVFFFCLH